MELRKRITVLSLVTSLALPIAGQADPATFQVDRAHSKVIFRVRHMGISTVTGQFREFDATITVDPEDLSTLTARASIDVASVDTEIERRDEHLRSADFFDAANHPTIEFVSKKAEVTGDKGVKLLGDLTIRGVTKPVDLDVDFGGVIKDSRGRSRTGMTASVTINRKDFGVSWNQLLDNGGLVVSDEVDILLEIEATQPTEPAD